MSWRFTPIAFVVLAAFLMAAFVFVYSWRRRTTPNARAFLPLMAGITLWLFCNLIETGFSERTPRLFWNNMQYIGIVVAPSAWFLFATVYTDHAHWLTRRNLGLLLIEPILVVSLVWTSEWHTLFREYMILNTSGSHPFWEWAPGPAFLLHAVYSYALLIGGLVLLAQAYWHSSRLYRRQIGVMLAGALVPGVANVLFILRGGTSIDPTPLSFLVTGIVVAWGIFGFGLVDISPIARNQVIERMRDGILVLDPQGRIIDANPAIKQMIGAVEDLTGKPVAQVFAHWPELMVQFRDVQEIDTEVSLVINEEDIRHYQLSISPLYDKQERYSGRLIIVHEITWLKQTETRLREAKKVAEEANRAKSTFLATMSHELRTPLAAIIGYSELILEKSKLWGYEKIVPQLGQIGAAATHLNALIGDILDMSKIEAGRMEIINTEFSVKELVFDVITTIQPLLNKNNNALDVKLSPEAGVMYADQTKVRQILLNLLGNATKFTKQGQITLEVNSSADSSNMYYFCIRDNGDGIPKEKIAQLFQPFVQADSSNTRKHGGSGLGLAISYQFCKMMGGSIRLESEPGRGTTCFVSLPAKVMELPKS